MRVGLDIGSHPPLNVWCWTTGIRWRLIHTSGTAATLWKKARSGAGRQGAAGRQAPYLAISVRRAWAGRGLRGALCRRCSPPA